MMRLALVPVVACLFATGCHTTPTRDQSAAPDFLVSASELEAQLGDKDVVVLHVARGESKAYTEGHIPGARLLPLASITTTRGEVVNEMPSVEELDKTFTALGIGNRSRIVVYDEEQGIWASRVFVTLDYLGHGDRTALLDGQLARWKAEERPLSTEAPTWKPARFTPKPRPEVIATLAEMEGLVGSEDVTLLDARNAADFRGEKEADLVPRPGHIPGACNVASGSNLTDEPAPLFKSIPELEALYPKGKPIVVYCRTGGQASQAYFTARMLGRDVRLYDGSYSEWSQQSSTPVQKGEAK